MSAARSLSPSPNPVEEFEELRPLLFSVAYRMLGTAASADDIVQESFLRYQGADLSDVRSLRSYLVTIVSRLCLDELKSARAKRVTYIGPWLPEPLLVDHDDPTFAPESAAEVAESVSMAFLVVLESLTPLERAVFLLHEVFDYAYPEIAAILGRSEAAVRQTGKRARERVSERRPRFHPGYEERKRLTLVFLAAAGRGDMEALEAQLSADVETWSDGGGKAAAATRPVVGRDRVVRFILGLLKKFPMDRYEFTDINGDPGFVGLWRGNVELAGVVDFDGEAISRILIVRNPDKLARIAAGLS